MPEPKKKYYAKESEKTEDDIANEKAYRAVYEVLDKAGKDPLDTIRDKDGNRADSELADRDYHRDQRDKERREASDKEYYLQRVDERDAFIAKEVADQMAHEGPWARRTPQKRLEEAKRFWGYHNIRRGDPDVERMGRMSIGEKGMAEAMARRADVQNMEKREAAEAEESLKEKIKKKLMMK